MYVPYFINDIHLVYSHTDTALTFHNAFKWSGLCFVQFTEACAPTQRVQLSSNFKKKKLLASLLSFAIYSSEREKRSNWTDE